MNKPEVIDLIEYLKTNLKINVETDWIVNKITVSIYIDKELISESTAPVNVRIENI